MGFSRLRRRIHHVVLAASLGGASACAAILGIQDTKDDGTSESEGGIDGRRDGTGIDGGPDNPDTGGGEAGKACPIAKGSSMILVGAFCIDTTETTNAQYKQFIDARGADAGGQPPECKFNTSFLPFMSWPYAIGKENFPVADVTWCSAQAYCEWTGKRLCGIIGTGTPVKASDTDIASLDEWMFACSHNAERSYPYGSSFSATACNGKETDSGAPVMAGSKAGCEGGYAGVFDMSGNVEEWENACESTTTKPDAGPFTDVCYVRGGNHNTPQAGLACKEHGRLFRGNHAGIRCCATATP